MTDNLSKDSERAMETGPLKGATGPHFQLEPGVGSADFPAGSVPAWEEVDAGRYMPRRVRGSCTGRALG